MRDSKHDNMRCPVCDEAILVVADREGIEVDYCPDCRGVWLDRGELDKIVARSREEDEPGSRRPPESIERHREQREQHLASQRRNSTRLAEKLFDF